MNDSILDSRENLLPHLADGEETSFMKPKQDKKHQALSAALRANLFKRKSQTRLRRKSPPLLDPEAPA